MPAPPLSRTVLCAALLAVVALSLLLPPSAAGALIRPLPGPVLRPFDYGPDAFAAGQHRGIDVAGRRGARVRAPCTGRIVFTGSVGRLGEVVSLRCGPWRVSLSPVSPAVGSGDTVRAGARLGLLGARVLQFGIRRERERRGYIDPERLLAAPAPGTGPLAPLQRRRAPRTRFSPPWRPGPGSEPSEVPLAAWLGAALAGTALGSGIVIAGRRKRHGRPRVRVPLGRSASET